MRWRWCVICAAATLAPAAPAASDDTSSAAAAADVAPAEEEPAAGLRIGWYSMQPGIARTDGVCFRLAASIGQPTPGYASGGSFVLSSGFLAGAPASGLDTIFFHGFEGCGT